jgi:hypothetical protein
MIVVIERLMMEDCHLHRKVSPPRASGPASWERCWPCWVVGLGCSSSTVVSEERSPRAAPVWR